MAGSAPDMTREAEKNVSRGRLTCVAFFFETKEERIICSEHGVQYSAVLWAYGQTVHEGFRQDDSMAGLPSSQEGCQGIPQDRLGDGG